MTRQAEVVPLSRLKHELEKLGFRPSIPGIIEVVQKIPRQPLEINISYLFRQFARNSKTVR